MWIPGPPSPARVEQFLQVVADADAYGVHCGGRRQRTVRTLRRVGIDKAVEEWKLSPSGPRAARALGHGAASAVAHDTTWKLTLSISSQVNASSPTRIVTAPRPRV